MRSTLQSERGTVLITILMISVLVTAVFLVFSSYTRIGAKSVTQTMAIQKATYSAESGYYAALNWVKTPAASSLTTVPTLMGSLTQGATYQLSLKRSTVDPMLVIIESKGFYPGQGGPVLDPLGQKAYSAVVEAKVRVEVIRDYFAVVPALLKIEYGSNIASGKVYGKELVFKQGVGPKTQVQAAYYFTSLTPDPSLPIDFVIFDGGAGVPPTKLSTELGAPRVTLMAGDYRDLAEDGLDCVLPLDGAGKCQLSGNWTVPENPNKVCYCPGELVLGAPGIPLTVYGNTVLYVEGGTHIMNSIHVDDPTENWLAVLSMENVSIEPSAPAPLTITGTYITDQTLIALGGERPGANLNFTGAFVAQQPPELSNFKGTRTYTYHAADQDLMLPFLIQPVAWALRKNVGSMTTSTPPTP